MIKRYIFCGIAFATVASGPAAARDIAAEAKQFPARMLSAHNNVRAGTGAQPLVWDNALGEEAARYAFALAIRGFLKHSDASARPNTGENLWMGTRGAFSPEAMVGGWSSERRLFVPGRFPSVSRSGTWQDVGHYTQMIWPGTRKVGCALASTRANDFLVCRYFPAGNVIGQFAHR